MAEAVMKNNEGLTAGKPYLQSTGIPTVNADMSRL